MTADERARKLVFPLGPDVAPVNIVFPEEFLFGPEDLIDLFTAAIRAAEQEAEQRGAEQAAITAENSGLTGCNNVAAAIRARAKQQEPA